MQMKSYGCYFQKFHLINPYLLSCVGLLLGLRVTKCFWNTISELASSASQGASGTQLLIWRVVEWAFVKTPMFTMVATSF
uniref:Transmembrane protein 39A n=1 Tax=Parascaris univalens TaxID=6257 RepID=A0A915A396_PARUN